MESDLDFLNIIAGYKTALQEITDKKDKRSYYHLIILDVSKNELEIKSYRRDQTEMAMSAYTTAEARALNGEEVDSVLVSAGPLNKLRAAYPNYFLDISEFIKNVQEIITKTK